MKFKARHNEVRTMLVGHLELCKVFALKTEMVLISGKFGPKRPRLTVIFGSKTHEICSCTRIFP